MYCAALYKLFRGDGSRRMTLDGSIRQLEKVVSKQKFFKIDHLENFIYED